MSSTHREPVAIVRSDGGVETAVRQAIALAGGLPDVAGKKVVVKPNLMCPNTSGSGQVTDSRVTGEVVRVALEAGAQVTIAEGSAAGFIGPTDQWDTLEAAEVSGHTALAKQLGVRFVDLNRDDYDEVPVPGHYALPTVPLPKTIAAADLVISVPILKTHPYSGLTLACKNFQGVMPWRNKRRTHRAGLEAALSDINKVVNPRFAVVDGIVGQNTRGHRPFGLVVAGPNCTVVDATCARIVGYPPDRLALLRFNAERGLGVIAEEQIEVRGLSIAAAAEAVGSPWDWAPAAFVKATPEVTWLVPDPYPCCACTYGGLVSLGYIKAAYGSEPLKGLRIAIGDGPVGPEKVRVDLAIGECAQQWATGIVEVGGRCPSPALVAAAICQLRDLDPAPMVAQRKRVVGSDWAEIVPDQG